jgi:hypothetical protein
MKNVSYRDTLLYSSPSIFALSIQDTYASEYIDWANTKIVAWYELVINILVTRGTVFITQLQEQLAPLIQLYEMNNITVGILPGLMFVPIIDFALVVVTILLFGWIALNWLT